MHTWFDFLRKEDHPQLKLAENRRAAEELDAHNAQERMHHRADQHHIYSPTHASDSPTDVPDLSTHASDSPRPPILLSVKLEPQRSEESQDSSIDSAAFWSTESKPDEEEIIDLQLVDRRDIMSEDSFGDEFIEPTVRQLFKKAQAKEVETLVESTN